MDKIINIRRVPFMKQFFGIILTFFAIILLIYGEFLFGGILCAFSLFFLRKDGSEINLRNSTYRTFVSFLGFKRGKWKILPKINYISVFKTTETTTLRALSAETNVTQDIIKLNLFYGKNQRITAYVTTKKDDAFTKAREIAKILNIKILDATERESKWI